jgi:hypothetical protein
MTAVPSIRESDFQRQVTDLAELLGWEWAHFRPAQTARGWRTPVSGSLGAGFPDLFLIRRRDQRALLLELKAEGRKPSPVQVETLRAFSEAGVEVHVFWPHDFDQIQAVLR